MFRKKTKGNNTDKPAANSEEVKTVRKIVAIIIISIVLILLVGGISGYMYIKSALKPVNPDSGKEVNVEIPMGSSTSDIASILEDNGVIKDSRVFRFYIKFKNESNFQAGEYKFSPAMTLSEIITALKKGEDAEESVYSVTVPEGESIDQIAEIFAKKMAFSKKEFLNKVNDPDYIKQLIDQHPDILSDDILEKDVKAPLEGYLFAATYEFYDDEPSIESIVQKMLKKTEKVVSPHLEAIDDHDMTVHEVLTMASLVENETSTKKERKTIAGVFYNRLDEGMPLQTDPTVLYALGEHKKKIKSKDLKVKSPYNTYYVDTLPAGPISNFSESSLNAAVNPKDTDYKYFLHDNDGKIHYAKHHDKHVDLKEKYIK